jgi:hypothetical protein
MAVRKTGVAIRERIFPPRTQQNACSVRCPSGVSDDVHVRQKFPRYQSAGAHWPRASKNFKSEKIANFYCGVLGFELTQRWEIEAAFALPSRRAVTFCVVS